MKFNQLYINGEWTNPLTDNHINVENPATLDIIAQVPAASAAEVNLAAESAAKAFPEWKNTPLQKRIDICTRMLEILETHRDEIIDLETDELGTPTEFCTAAHYEFQMERIRTFIRLAPEIKTEEVLENSTQYREPYGVVAAITPWNYPLGQVIQKVMPAILMGNTVILKPSQHTPLTTYYLIDAFHQAGLPAGVLNLITGRGGEVGNVLSEHPLIDMISFTGSTSGGIEVGTHGLKTVKNIHLELGGKSPFIILPDADIDTAIRACLNSCFLNTGQTCSALSRLIIPVDMKQEIESRLIAIYPEYRVGNPKKEGTKIGPLANANQFKKVNEYIELGIQEGARILIGTPVDHSDNGYYINPIIFTDVTNDMRIAQEEIFGPVLSVITYDSIETAINIANDSLYGLSGAVHGNHETAVQVAKQLLTGNIYINAAPRDVTAPFGGYKQSGIGREGGIQGLLDFTQVKVLFDK